MWEQADICTLCGAPGAYPSTTDVPFQRDGISVTFGGLPAVRCDACNDAAVHGPLVLELERLAEAAFDAIGKLPRTQPVAT
jgi:hypothetical protein